MISVISDRIHDLTMGKVRDADERTLLANLGLDSLDFASLLLLGEQESGRIVERVDWSRLRTVGDFVALFETPA